MTAIPIWFVSPQNFAAVRDEVGAVASGFAEACGFEPKPGKLQLLPGPEGRLAGALFGEDPSDPLQAGKLATGLPPGIYRFAAPPARPELAALAFLLACYRFDRYKAAARPAPSLEAPEGVDFAKATRIAAAVAHGRDLVNLPANALTPSALEAEAVELAERFGAEVRIVMGEDLAAGFPLIAAVGAAAAEAPRLVDFTWGRADAPKVTLVGKGVVFDTGGLDIKPANGMELMKKDMGGAATALTLARLVMEDRLDVRLRVLLPIVENAISGPAMRPGDIYRSRKGLSVEIGNTDAEGRLILADALTLAAEETPDLLLDFATLTGAARVALGPDLPPFYTDDEALAAEIARFAQATCDPLWRLPLWGPYDSMLDSPAADLNNAPSGGFAGSITAALFLRRFAAGAKCWAHFDVYAWNPKARATGPQGGEIQSARALHALLWARYGGG
ncbi:MAG TPA: leucyl aminopeptidase family protein [Roseiarcus sp.]|nr:leucyl aminopeptidase family protein [Roseiarcus sp.]